MSSVTVNIAGRGTPTSDGGTSSVGHVWYSLGDGNGNSISYGFSPDANNIGSPFAPGEINVHGSDDYYYQGRDSSRTIEITQAQYNAMKNFGENPSGSGFSTQYNGLTNSCIDFTWKALEVAGLNPKGYQGSLWPTNNISDLRKFIELSPIQLQRLENFLRNTFPITWDSVISRVLGTTPDPLLKTTIYVDPLILDLDGDGLEITPLSKGVLFDANGDTIRTGTAWAGADDGILVWDRNGNGTVECGGRRLGGCGRWGV
jgi:hypothetical protein